MSQTQTDVSTDFPDDSEEQCQALVRALKRRRGFGLLFVRCSPAQGEQLIARVRKDIPQKTIDVLRLDKTIDNLYEIIDSLPNKDHLDILFITGIERSLVDYIKPGIGGQGDYYKEDTVPRILGHLNLQRERFRDNFKMCFVFLLPLYALKYFIRRAPDFFDWRSGVWEIPTSSELVQQESSRIVLEGDYEEYKKLTPQERKQKILEIQELLEENNQKLEQKAELLFEQGNLFLADKEYQAANDSYDKALELQSHYHQAWYNWGIALGRLGRNKEAIASFDKAIELKPDYHQAWYNRGIALVNLERYETAIASFDKAIELQPNFHQVWQAWYYRGLALLYLGRYTEAIASFDRTIQIKRDFPEAWSLRGVALSQFRCYEEAIASYDKALRIKPGFPEAWYDRGNALSSLRRYEEAIASYNKATEYRPDYHEAWYNRGMALGNLGRLEEAIASYDKAIEFRPDAYQPWNNRGNALKKLGRLHEALISFSKALEIKSDLQQAWYNKACCYALLGNVNLAIENLQQAINLNPDEYREWAKTESDFDSIREDRQFQALIDG